jgi:Flp pilus assembly protein TadG
MQRHSTILLSETGKRRGAAVVEFAVLIPLFLMLVLGTWEMGTALTAGTKMAAAIREGGRLASMDFQDTLGDDETINEKVIKDIKNFLTASGIPGDMVTITITHADGENAGEDFDLADGANYLELFTIRALVNYEDISTFPLDYMAGQQVEAKLVFRKGRVSLDS